MSESRKNSEIDEHIDKCNRVLSQITENIIRRENLLFQLQQTRGIVSQLTKDRAAKFIAEEYRQDAT